MAFVSRKISQVEYNSLFARLKGPRVQAPSICVEDEARGLMLMSLGVTNRNRDPLWEAYYNLFVGDQTIAIEAKPDLRHDKDQDVFWLDLTALALPCEPEARADDIRDLLEEAFAAWFGTLRRRAIRVRVALPSDILRV